MIEPSTEDTAQVEPAGFRWVISLSFWFTLLFATTVYASVALAPKLLVWMQLKGDYVANQIQLVNLEQQVHYLSSVSDALENDPQFAAEMARVEFNATHPGDDRIPVDASLSLSSRTSPATIERPAVQIPWYSPIVKRLATNQPLRITLLTIAAALAIFAFTFLHDGCEAQLRSIATNTMRVMRQIVSRYTAAPVTTDNESA